jgi:hypothetical protein
VLAHLEDLVARGIVATDGDPVIGGILPDGVGAAPSSVTCDTELEQGAP